MVVEVGGHCPHTPPTPYFQIHTILFPPAPHFGDSSPRPVLIPLPTHLGGRISPGDCSNNTQPSPHRQPLWWERFIPVNHQLLEWAQGEGAWRTLSAPMQPSCNALCKGPLILKWWGGEEMAHSQPGLHKPPEHGVLLRATQIIPETTRGCRGSRDAPWRREMEASPHHRHKRLTSMCLHLALVAGSEAWQVFWGQYKTVLFFCFVNERLPEAGHSVLIRPVWAEWVSALAWPC